MEDLLIEAVKESGGSGFIWPLLVWILGRELIPEVVKKLRTNKTPYLEALDLKVNYLYKRERDRHAVEKYKNRHLKRKD